MAARREAQLAASVEADAAEHLTAVGRRAGAGRERWLARATGQRAAHLAAMRDRLLDAADLRRHDRVLDLGATTGLVTWEALRRAPGGGVWVVCADTEAAGTIQALAEPLDPADRPICLTGEELARMSTAADGDGLEFDVVVGLNPARELAGAAAGLTGRLAPEGRFSLAFEGRASPTPADLLRQRLDPDDLRALVTAEDQALASLGQGRAPAADFAAALREAGLAVVVSQVALDGSQPVSRRLVSRWTGPEGDYARLVGAALAPRLWAAVQAQLAGLVGAPDPTFRVGVEFLQARRASA